MVRTSDKILAIMNPFNIKVGYTIALHSSISLVRTSILSNHYNMNIIAGYAVTVVTISYYGNLAKICVTCVQR